MSFEKVQIGNCILYRGKYEDVLGSGEIESASVDCILTDPPFGCTNLEWDKPIDLSEFWEHIKRVRTDNANSLIFAGGKNFPTDLILSNRREYRYDYTWSKNKATGFLSVNRRPLAAKESILRFVKEKFFCKSVYNPQMIEISQ